MRLLAWLGGIFVVAATVATAGVVAIAHQHAADPRLVVAARQPAALDACCQNDPTVAAPHRPFRPNPSPTPERIAWAVNSTQQALINHDRAQHGQAPLAWSSCLYNIARAQAAHLATPGVKFQHYGGVQQDLSCALGSQAGENIAWYSLGPNDSWANSAFVASPDHYANIVGPYHYVATAWAVDANGYGYIAVEFG
jgi:uncharacterized protein YkwD